MNQYLGILMLLGVATAGFLLPVLILKSVLGPRNRTRTKQLPFECGSVSVGEVGEQRFNVRFFLVAILFILFDIEVIFLYPWAVTLPQIGWFAYIQMLIFVLVLSVGLLYVWRKGVLDWNRN
jgi:NADH-quinone oxidoreductase subunit A